MASAGNGTSAAKLLVEKAVWTWRHKFPRAKIDDCAAVCLFFKEDRLRPLLTKPVSPMTHEVDARSHTGSAKSDDALDTVLNCDTKEKNAADQLDSDRVRKRRMRKKMEYVGS